MKMSWGRIHILTKGIEMNKVYADVHWDALVHFIMFGVDYAKRPKKICKAIIIK